MPTSSITDLLVWIDIIMDIDKADGAGVYLTRAGNPIR